VCPTSNPRARNIHRGMLMRPPDTIFTSASNVCGGPNHLRFGSMLLSLLTLFIILFMRCTKTALFLVLFWCLINIIPPIVYDIQPEKAYIGISHYTTCRSRKTFFLGQSCFTILDRPNFKDSK